MREKIFALLTLGLLIAVTWSILGTYAETEVPSLSVGDSWTYAVTDHITGDVYHNYTVTIDKMEDCEGVPCYVWITSYPESTLKEWITKEEGDWIILKLNHNYTVIGDIVRDEMINVTYSPGMKLFDFPLSVGKEWSGESNVSCSVKLSNGEIVHEPSYISSWHRKVISTDSITVPAGTFDTYLVEEIIFHHGIENPHRAYWYFCDNVTNYVKHDHYEPEDDQQYSQGDLISYKLAQQGNGSLNLHLIIALAAPIGVLGFTFVLYNRRRQSTWNA